MATSIKPLKFLSALPNTIKVGPYTWNIVLRELPELWGQTDMDSLSIFLRPEMPSRELAVTTLLHELYHVMLMSFDQKHPRTEEAGARAVSSMYVTVFRDNPWLTSWIKKGLK